jgi:hypothetical protein
MLKIINAEWDIMLNGKKRQPEIISNIRNTEWGIMLNGKKRQPEIMSKVIFKEYASG